MFSLTQQWKTCQTHDDEREREQAAKTHWNMVVLGLAFKIALAPLSGTKLCYNHVMKL